MKKLFALLAVFIITGISLAANAATTTPEQVLAFFNKYVDAANRIGGLLGQFAQ